MYLWYQQAAQCYAYLSDVPASVDLDDPNSAFAHSRWFHRGWTLQELLAPEDLTFFSQDWKKIGIKSELTMPLSDITAIDNDILAGKQRLEAASIAKRMSWAAYRETTRPEDRAYCLMGVFSVNMPMLYGEGGERAFIRLQEEIMKESDDQSLFAWVDENADEASHYSLLAKLPSLFAYSKSIIPYQDWEPRPPYLVTNRGLQIALHLTRRHEDIYTAALDCPAPPDYEDFSFLAIYVKKLSGGDD